MKVRLAAFLQPDSIVDGEGIRTVIWTQGCPHNCFGCHNPETHNFDGGELVDLEEIYEIIDNLEGQDGITFSGGDPFMQPKECALIASYAKAKGYNIWAYSGYTYDEIINLSKSNKSFMKFLKEIDVLVDGKFDISLRSYSSVFRGSSNQRIIDVKKSLDSKNIVLIDKYDLDVCKSNRQREKGVYI